MSIILNNVSFSYTKGAYALRNIDLQINSGQFVLLLGHNGAGKSTMLRMLNGILKPQSGKVMVMGKETHKHKTAELAVFVSVTFQNPADQIFAPSVRKELEFGPNNLRKTNKLALVDDALSMFELDSVSDIHPYDLSYSKRKLLTIASAFAMDTPILAFDEPTAGLSHPETQLVLGNFKHLVASGKTILVVSHSIEHFLNLCSQVNVISNGSIVFSGDVNEFHHNVIQLRRYGVRLPLPYRFRPHFGLSIIPSTT